METRVHVFLLVAPRPRKTRSMFTSRACTKYAKSMLPVSPIPCPIPRVSHRRLAATQSDDNNRNSKVRIWHLAKNCMRTPVVRSITQDVSPRTSGLKCEMCNSRSSSRAAPIMVIVGAEASSCFRRQNRQQREWGVHVISVLSYKRCGAYGLKYACCHPKIQSDSERGAGASSPERGVSGFLFIPNYFVLYVRYVSRW